MRLVLQRAIEASVVIEGSTYGSIRNGLVVFVGIGRGDTQKEADYLLAKMLGIRIFPDGDGKMNKNVKEAGGSLLIISQFTLYADCRRGNRPSFDRAAPAEEASRLYQYFVDRAREGPVPVETGIFQASMQVHLTNDGPVTILLDSEQE